MEKNPLHYGPKVRTLMLSAIALGVAPRFSSPSPVGCDADSHLRCCQGQECNPKVGQDVSKILLLYLSCIFGPGLGSQEWITGENRLAAMAMAWVEVQKYGRVPRVTARNETGRLPQETR